MTGFNQNNLEHLQDMLAQGKMTADEANVAMVRMERVKIVTTRLPAQVRKSLNAAVKRGELSHLKRDGHKPETYFHPTFDFLARSERRKHERNTLAALAGIKSRPFETVTI